MGKNVHDKIAAIIGELYLEKMLLVEERAQLCNKLRNLENQKKKDKKE